MVKQLHALQQARDQWGENEVVSRCGADEVQRDTPLINGWIVSSLVDLPLRVLEKCSYQVYTWSETWRMGDRVARE